MEAEAAKRKDRYTTVDELMLGLLSVPSPAKELLEEAGLTGLRSRPHWTPRGSSRPVASRTEEAQDQALEVRPRPTALARERKLDPVIGRDEEIPASNPDPLPSGRRTTRARLGIRA